VPASTAIAMAAVAGLAVVAVLRPKPESERGAGRPRTEAA
jgi:hypothetical protein